MCYDEQLRGKGVINLDGEMKKGLRVSILASGSTGNVTYIESDQTKLLIDCGLSGKKTTELLKSIGRSPADLDGILVTHEHADHIKGIGVLARRYELPVYANEKTWSAMGKKVGAIHDSQKFFFERDRQQVIGDIDVMSFGVSHDAIDPQFYAFEKDGRRFVILTDTGYVSERLRGQLHNAHAYLLEANHDVNLLRMGSYPWHLKQRIISDKGHLSNEDSSLAIAEMLGPATKRIYLGHLSQENNMKEIARGTMSDILTQKDIGLDEQFFLYDTDPAKAQDLFDV